MEQEKMFKDLQEYTEWLKEGVDCLEENTFLYSQKIQSRQERIKNKKFKVGLIGTFSSGKTTIIKALLGQKDLLPTSDSPTTSCITKICYGEKEEIQIKKDTKLLMNLLLTINSNTMTLMQAVKNDSPRFDFKKVEEYFYQGIFDNCGIYKVLGRNKKEIQEIVNKATKEAKEKDKYSTLPFLLTDYNGYFQIERKYLPNEFSKENQAYVCNELNISENKIKEILALQEVIEKILFNKTIETTDLTKLKDINFIDGLNIGLENLCVSDCIKEIIVKTNKFNLGKDIELIDIPGLNNNETHNKIATDIASDLQSLIIVQGIGGDTIEGNSKELILEIKKDFASIFKNSYLLLNKYSVNKDEQDNRLEVLNNLKTTFGIKEERTFRIDALNYLNKQPECYQFEEFKNKLKDDCEHTLIKEFEKNVVEDLNDIHETVENDLGEKIKKLTKGINGNAEENKRSVLECIKEEKYLEHFKYLKNCINKIEECEEKITEEEKLQMIDKSINASLHKINKDKIKKIATSGKDIHFIETAKVVEQMLEQCEFNSCVRKQYLDLIQNKFNDKFKNLLNKYFDDSVLKLSSIKSKTEIEKIKNKDIKERLMGIMDIIFIEFGPKKDDIKYTIEGILSKNKEDKNSSVTYSHKYSDEIDYTNAEEIIELCYENLEEQLDEYLEDISKNIEKYTNAIIKNYVYDIVQELKEIFINDKNYEREYKINVEKEEKNGIEEKIEQMKKELNEYSDILSNIEELKNKIMQ